MLYCVQFMYEVACVLSYHISGNTQQDFRCVAQLNWRVPDVGTWLCNVMYVL